MLQEMMCESEVLTLSDLPLVVVAAVTIHWGRIDREFEMKTWAWECPTPHLRQGSFLYYVAYNAQHEPFIQITEEDERSHAQRTWRLLVSDIREKGCKAPVERI